MRFTGIVLATFISAVLAKPTPYYDDYPLKAVVVLTNDSQNVTGTVTFTQAYRNGGTEVYAKIKGLVSGTKHGFHVHETGDLSGGCESLGLHFNPFNQDHGSPSSKVRHVADFGNVEQYEDDWSTLKL
jgi:Cu-Zn family superoxide dismutase